MQVEKGQSKNRVILVTNDDGYKSGGIEALIEMVKPLGRVVVVAPEEGNSGMSHAITIKVPLRMKHRSRNDDVELYSVNGTPVDCVKLAMNELFATNPPDLMVSGINHGSNASISVVYSGTIAAAIEGCLYGIPSVGFSILDYGECPDFRASIIYGREILKGVLEKGISPECCLNVNIPVLPPHEIKGVKVARQNRGSWREEFEKRTDPRGVNYYWLTGYFHNDEPEATDTDEYYLSKGYITVVPVNVDLTDYQEMKKLQGWENDLYKAVKNELSQAK
jgi:5'-nucleotidase